MWNTDTPWFDVTVVMTIFAIGNIFFGHFEEHKPKGLRALKVICLRGSRGGPLVVRAPVGVVRHHRRARPRRPVRARLVAAEPWRERADRRASRQILRAHQGQAEGTMSRAPRRPAIKCTTAMRHTSSSRDSSLRRDRSAGREPRAGAGARGDSGAADRCHPLRRRRGPCRRRAIRTRQATSPRPSCRMARCRRLTSTATSSSGRPTCPRPRRSRPKASRPARSAT